MTVRGVQPFEGMAGMRGCTLDLEVGDAGRAAEIARLLADARGGRVRGRSSTRSCPAAARPNVLLGRNFRLDGELVDADRGAAGRDRGRVQADRTAEAGVGELIKYPPAREGDHAKHGGGARQGTSVRIAPSVTASRRHLPGPGGFDPCIHPFKSAVWLTDTETRADQERAMLGGMQDFELRVTRLIDHAAREHGDARDRHALGRRQRDAHRLGRRRARCAQAGAGARTAGHRSRATGSRRWR